MCSFKTAIAGQHVAILTGFLVIQLVGTVRGAHPRVAGHVGLDGPLPFVSTLSFQLFLKLDGDVSMVPNQDGDVLQPFVQVFHSWHLLYPILEQ